MRYKTLWDTAKGRELLRKNNPSVYNSMMRKYGIPKAAPPVKARRSRASETTTKPEQMRNANAFLKQLSNINYFA